MSLRNIKDEDFPLVCCHSTGQELCRQVRPTELIQCLHYILSVSARTVPATVCGTTNVVEVRSVNCRRCTCILFIHFLDPTSSNPKHILNCVSDTGKPQTAQQKEIEILREVCPHLIPDDGSPPSLCCSLKQLEDLKTNFELPSSLVGKTCPTCYHNFKKVCNS